MAGTAPTRPDEAAATFFIAPGAAAARKRSDRLYSGARDRSGWVAERASSFCQSSVFSRESGACVAGLKCCH